MKPRAKRLPVGDEGEWLVVGQERWALWHHPRARSTGYVRFAPAEPSSWHVVELRFVTSDRSDGVKANDLRLLTLGQIEAAANDPEVQQALLHPDAPGLPELHPDRLDPASAVSRCEALPVKESTVSLRVVPPPRGQRDQTWYLTLAFTYAHAKRMSRHPARAIAEASDVPVTTVHAWLKALRKFQQDEEAARKAEVRRLAGLRREVEARLAAFGLTEDEYIETHNERDDPIGYWADHDYEVLP